MKPCRLPPVPSPSPSVAGKCVQLNSLVSCGTSTTGSCRMRSSVCPICGSSTPLTSTFGLSKNRYAAFRVAASRACGNQQFGACDIFLSIALRSGRQFHPSLVNCHHTKLTSSDTAYNPIQACAGLRCGVVGKPQLVAELRRALRKARSLRRTPRSFFYSRRLKHPTDFVVNGCQNRFTPGFTPQTKTASDKKKRVTAFLLSPA